MIKSEIEEKLSDLPSEWREKLAIILCQIQDNLQVPPCEQVRECETLTSLSPFSVNGTSVSIQFKDEKGVTVTRSFDVEQLINSKLDEVNPSCISGWEEMTLTERLEALIDKTCQNCQTYYTYTDQLEEVSSEDNLPCNTLFNLAWLANLDDFQQIGIAVTVYGTTDMTYSELAEAIEALGIFQSVEIDTEGNITVQVPYNVNSENISIILSHICPT